MFLLRDDILDIAAILAKGGIICYPTDTIWGIGCDAQNPAAVARLHTIRGAAPESGYISLVADLPMLKQYATRIHPRLETLLAHHTRPLTVIYERVSGLADGVAAPDGTGAFRIAQDQFCQELVQALGRPLVSTAACKVGQPYPPTFGAISSEILGAVDYVVKYRQDDRSLHEPSSIARMDRHLELEFLRD